MKILIIGSGGREHAIGSKLKEDNPTVDLYFSPGNGGTEPLGKNIVLHNIHEIVHYAKSEAIDLTIVGSEELLVKGIVDVFKEQNLRIFGPNQRIAQLEGSKAFAKEFMEKHGVKTAQYRSFTGYYTTRDYLEVCHYPIVIKADGLAAGKGVFICESEERAKEVLKDIMKDKIFGDSGNKVVIEEYLEGKEASILAYINEKEIIPFISAKDHKKIGAGEEGLNTGGMGAIAPNPYVTPEVEAMFNRDILRPTLAGLEAEKMMFSGVIFFGLMITSKGVYLLEYNLRMGDPETQAILPLMKSNLLKITQKALAHEPFEIEWKPLHTCCVVLVSGGYPLNYETGFVVEGVDHLQTPHYVSGAVLRGKALHTSGGRVLSVVGMGETEQEARKNAYKEVDKIHFDYQYYRKDIGA